MTPKEAILAAVAEGERLRGEAVEGRWIQHDGLPGYDLGCVVGPCPIPEAHDHKPGEDRSAVLLCANGNYPETTRARYAAFCVHAANSSPWGALRVLTEAIGQVECGERCTGLGEDYTGGHHHTCSVPELEAALSEAARVLQGQERKG